MNIQAYFKGRDEGLYVQMFFLGIQLSCTYNGLHPCSIDICALLYDHRIFYFTSRDVIIKSINLRFDIKRSLQVTRLGTV